ncbi:MAG: glycosyltransferase [Terriglobia bacterium]|jgi:glycosyltransferase involved in cell wall biosynthesis
MAYLIKEIELSQPIPSLSVPEGHEGVAFNLRRNGRPVGFFMKPAGPGTELTSEEVAALIAENTGAELLGEGQENYVPRIRSGRLPPLTVAVCTRDRPEDLARCLEHLLRLRAAASVACSEFEILVVDNAPSDDRAKNLVDSLPGVRYVREPLPGLDFARNRAIRESRADLLAYIDDDVVVDRGWLGGLKEAWTENPDAGAFTGPVLPYELVTRPQVLFEERAALGRKFTKRRFDPTRPGSNLFLSDFGPGCNMVFRRDVLVELGGFDEALDTGDPLPGGGDLDIFYRVGRAGHVMVYEPRLLIYHRDRRQYRELRYQMWTWGLAYMAFLAKCYRTDASQRSRCGRAMLMEFVRMVYFPVAPLVRRRVRPWPLDLTLVELLGGVVGLLGEYGRSQRRVERIRRQYSSQESAQ